MDFLELKYSDIGALFTAMQVLAGIERMVVSEGINAGNPTDR